MVFGSRNHNKRTAITAKSNTFKQHLKRWIGWGSKKTQQPKLSPPSFDETLPLSSCVDEGIYDDATSSCPLIPKTSCSSSICSALSNLNPCASMYSSDMSIMDEPTLVKSPLNTSSFDDTIIPLQPSMARRISTDTIPKLPTWNQSLNQVPSLANSILDMESGIQNIKNNQYLVYEWPSDDDDDDARSSINLASWMNLATQVLDGSATSVTRSSTHYFDCTSPHDRMEILESVDQDLFGSNSSFYSTNSSFTISYDDSASILDRDALLLVTHGVEFLKRRENTNWDDNDQPQTMTPSYSGITLVPLEGQEVSLLDRDTTRAQEDEQELHRLVNAHILF